MIELSLMPVPNQRFTASLGGHLWEILIKKANVSMVASVSCDGEVLINSSRIVCGQPMIPFRHLSQNGNFLLTTINDEEPDWTNFSDSQRLFFVGPDND